MKKACISIMLVIIMLMIPAPAYAADGTISVSGTRDISEFGSNSVITINPGLTVRLTNNNKTVYTNTAVVCGEGVKLTLDGVKIDNYAFYLICPFRSQAAATC